MQIGNHFIPLDVIGVITSNLKDIKTLCNWLQVCKGTNHFHTSKIIYDVINKYKTCNFMKSIFTSDKSYNIFISFMKNVKHNRFNQKGALDIIILGKNNKYILKFLSRVVKIINAHVIGPDNDFEYIYYYTQHPTISDLVVMDLCNVGYMYHKTSIIDNLMLTSLQNTHIGENKTSKTIRNKFHVICINLNEHIYSDITINIKLPKKYRVLLNEQWLLDGFMKLISD